MRKNPQRYLYLMIILGGIYIALALLNPPTAETLHTYNLTAAKAMALVLSIDFFFIAIWLVAAYGFVRVYDYSVAIRRSKEGPGFRKIAAGVGILAFRQPITSIIGTIFNAINLHHPSFTATSVIIINYLGVAAALLGFGLLAAGVQNLTELTGKRTRTWVHYAFRFMAIVLIAIYTYLAFGHGGYQTPIAPGSKAIFYLPSWLIVSTIIVPYGYTWYMALFGAYQLRQYSRFVKGVIYKKALNLLAIGLNIIIFSTVMIQFLGTQSSKFSKLHVGPLVMLINLVLVVIAAGYIVLALGAKKLKRIEEV